MVKAAKRIIIWDFDGTLAWRPGGWSGALLKVLDQAALKHTISAEAIRPFLQSGFPWHAPENAHPGLSAEEWWEDLYPVFMRAFRAAGAVNGKAYELAAHVRPVYTDPVGWRRFDDALPALDALSRLGWTQVLLTNHVPELPSLLERLDLNGRFVKVFNSAETGYEKPNPKAFRAVTEWAGPGATCWVVGDRYATDVLGAHEFGLPAVLVRNPHPEAEHFSENLQALVKFFESIP